VIRVARLGRPSGLKGFIGVYVDVADQVYFEVGNTVYIADDRYTVSAIRQGSRGHEVAFVEVPDRATAEVIRNLDVFVTDRRPGDLKGLDVRPAGGVVVDVQFGTAQDRLVVERDGNRFEVPFVGELVPVVDIENGYVEIVEIEGLS
jgi:16S rRNA processing protein RimM